MKGTSEIEIRMAGEKSNSDTKGRGRIFLPNWPLRRELKRRTTFAREWHNGELCSRKLGRTKGTIMDNNRNTSEAMNRRWASAAGAAALGLMAMVSLAATPAKAPPYLPLNVHVGEKAPDFALPSADGSTVKLSQFAGRNVLLDFYEGYW